MGEADFWPSLEFRVCRELAGLRDRRYRSWWCDGFLPDLYDASTTTARVTGRVYLGASGQDLWDFTLVAGCGIGSWEQLDWSALLPADDVTGWLSLDMDRKAVRIDPMAAHPDPVLPCDGSAPHAK